MPIIDFEGLPDDGRVWVFAADRELSGAQADRVLGEVDTFLQEWNAHGAPLRCARDWRDGRFLAVGVDQTETGASGCSIDGLFRVFKGMQGLGANFLNRGLVFWRDDAGLVRSNSRLELKELVRSGGVGSETIVFDTAVTTVGDWRTGFEVPAGKTWLTVDS